MRGSALLAFSDDLLKPEDEAALLVFNHESRVLLGWTTDRGRLLEALEGVRPTGGTAIYDAINSACRCSKIAATRAPRSSWSPTARTRPATPP